MTIEEEIFKRAIPNYNLLIKYGFSKSNDYYIYEKSINNNDFLIIIKIYETGLIQGRIIDTALNEEYTNFRIEKINGEFTSSIKTSFIELLLDIRNRCFKVQNFIFPQSNRIAEYVLKKYNDKPIFAWEKSPGFGIFKNHTNKKWYGLIMNIKKSKFDNCSEQEIEIINLKVDKNQINELLTINGIYEAYHMNKKNWVSIILDDSLEDKTIFSLLDKSYEFTNIKKR